ncbi:MAG: Nif11-like leader peptide family natural product precursor [Lentisphaeria bacterium]|nr:Nif11-like leader peptide family natural product precursor [Lentisphaeria bacterium]
MSLESARAFCVVMMSDEEFRNKLAAVKSPAEIDAVLKEEGYDFKKAELEKIVGEFMGKTLAPGELDNLVYGFYEEQIAAGNKEVCDVVAAWMKDLA